MTKLTILRFLKYAGMFILGMLNGMGKAFLVVVAGLVHIYLLQSVIRDLPTTTDNTQAIRVFIIILGISMCYVMYLLLGRSIIAEATQSYKNWKEEHTHTTQNPTPKLKLVATHILRIWTGRPLATLETCNDIERSVVLSGATKLLNELDNIDKGV